MVFVKQKINETSKCVLGFRAPYISPSDRLIKADAAGPGHAEETRATKGITNHVHGQEL